MTPRNWHHGHMCLFDLETTGVDAHRDRIVSAAVIHVPAPVRPQEWLVNPGIPIPDGAAAIHGITTDMAQADGEDAQEAVLDIASTLMLATQRGIPVVGHNVVYDLTMLWAELVRHGHPTLADSLLCIRPVIDTFVLDKWADTYRKGSRKLIDTARHYGVTLTDEEAHGATADALAAGRIAWHMANRYPGLQMPLKELHQEQIGWKRDQAESFGRYLTKNGKVDDVSRDWPIQTPPDGWTPDQLPTPREETP